MKYLFFISALFLTLVAFSESNEIERNDRDNPNGNQQIKWELIWEDNFDTDGLPNESIWDYEEGYVRNNEAQYYTRNRLENARVENGNLVVEARNDNWDGKEITSASLITKGKKHILFGKIEVRAKLPTGKGAWPAIWMLGTSFKNGTRWPDCGEIDIMENVGFDPDKIHGNIHTKSYNHVIGTNKGNSIIVEKPYADFHVYTIEWFETRIDFFVDGEKYFSFANENTGKTTWPFDDPHYLIINLAIGGGWGGQQGIDDSIFPQKYYIDYVKVYKQK
ncbi:MAG: glycoside hydrolase family 16 protein [Mariniphaga sp.]|nr:glycoside hydrolase family 16 protein [Mariniphaga sp.]